MINDLWINAGKFQFDCIHGFQNGIHSDKTLLAMACQHKNVFRYENPRLQLKIVILILFITL